jgi:hypothetical protein
MNKPTVSQKALRLIQRKAKEAAASPKSQKHRKPFSQSRDTREDRDTRQMKTGRTPQTFPHPS